MRFLAFFLFAFFFITCNDSPKIPENFDYGKVENGIYKNDFFNFEIPVPTDWIVQNKDQMNQISEEGRKIVSEKNKELGEKIKASEIRSAMLLSVFQYKDDSVTGVYNPSFGIAIEKVPRGSGIKNGEDYLKSTKTLMQQSGIAYRFPTGFVSQELGGRKFTIMETVATYKGSFEVGQLYYATIDKGFAIAIISSFGTDEQREKLRQIVAGIRFK